MPQEFKPIKGAIYRCKCNGDCVGVGAIDEPYTKLTSVIGGRGTGRWVDEACSTASGTPKLLFLPANGETIELRCE